MYKFKRVLPINKCMIKIPCCKKVLCHFLFQSSFLVVHVTIGSVLGRKLVHKYTMLL